MPKMAVQFLLAAFGVALFHDAFLLVSYLYRQRGRNVSPVVLPFVGPLCVVVAWGYGAPLWIGLFVLLLDGVNPLLVRALLDAGATSRLTRIVLLQGRREYREVRLSLHRGDRFVLVSTGFVLVSTWYRPPRKMLVSQVSRTGEYKTIGAGYELTLNSIRTILVEREEENYKLIDDSGDLDGWRLRR